MSEKIIKKITDMGKGVVSQIDKEENPYVDIPIRSLSNTRFDEKTGLLSLGDAKSKRYFAHIAHARKFMQTMLVSSQCKKILEQKVHTSIRDLYYSIKHTIPGTKEVTFEEQDESDPIIEDLEVMLDVLREQLNLNANRKGFMVGDITFTDSGDFIDASKLGSGGFAIPSNVEDEIIKFKDTKAKYVLVIEKNAIGERLNEDKFWKKQNCILVTAQGQPSRGIRRLIYRLHNELDLPIHVFTDADAYGYYIYSVIKQGSINLAYTSANLAVPDADFVGLTLTDIDKYGLKEYTIKEKDIDLKRAKELLNYQWFKAPEWQEEIKLMITKGYKAEQEALSGKGIKFVSEEYLPDKIKRKDFLP
jgi:DNA topoisomerase-6 subunit A